MTAPSTPAPAQDGRRFLDPRVLARIGSLELLARTVVEGFLSGLHRSARLGSSVDFAEHRQYMPGDDIRRIDWRLYARTDRYHVKEFEADTNTNVHLLVDVSKSMDYGTTGITKLDYARFVAACLAYFSDQQRDRVGLATFDSEVVEYLSPSARRMTALLHVLGRSRAERQGSLLAPMRRLGEQLRRRGIVVLLSDLYEEPEILAQALGHLRGRGSDVVVMHVLDPSELALPFEGAMSIEDLESGDRLPIVGDSLRDRYGELLAQHLQAVQRACAELGADYALFDTSRPLDFALFDYLTGRQRLARTR